MEGLGSGGETDGWGYGGYATSTNPFFSTFAPTVAKEAVAANPNKLVTLGNTGGYYTYDNYLGPDGNGTPIYGQTPWQGFDASGRLTSSGVMQKDNPASLFALAALAAGGMAFGLPALMGQGAAGGLGAGASFAGDAFLPGALGAEGAGLGALSGLEGFAAGAGGAAAGAGGGLFGGLGSSLSGGLGGLLGGSAGGGSMWGGLLGGALSLGGSLISANAAKSAAGQYNQAAMAAADASKFRPVGITTRFGSSNFGYDSNGNLVNAGYNLSPELTGFREKLLDDARATLGNARGIQGTANSLFDLGRGYLSQSPEEAASNWMTKQQSVLAPGRERALSGIRTNLFNTGREGLSVGATGTRPDGSAGLGAANPELEAYYNSLAQQDSQLAAGADQFARDQITFGQGLLSSGIDLHQAAYNPFKTALGLSNTVDGLGANTLSLGSELGGRASSAGANAAQSLLSGASAMQGANSYSPFAGFLTGMGNNPQLMSGLGNWAGGLFGGTAPHITQMPSKWDLG